MALSLFIGYNARDPEPSAVCAYSVKKRSSIPLIVHDLKLADLRAKGLYTRPTETRGNQQWDVVSDAPMSTDFAISRFFTPLLSETPWAVFCDNDLLWLEDIAQLFALADPKYAVMCVKHEYAPPESTKLDNQAQTHYARKNWSSLMLWNCKHPANAALNIETVNSVPGRDLHRFFWLQDQHIGALPQKWNWLEGHSDPTIVPAAIHYTRGGPWYAHMKDCMYAKEWLDEQAEMKLQ